MLTSKEPVAITALAYDFCFASPSDFAHHYHQEFGELPSQTLKVRNGGAML
jgi:transcriptional regulator GlxA family with amidase domain